VPPTPHVYADRIVNVAVTGPLVRLELGALAANPDDPAKPTLQPTQTVVLPLDGFLASFGLMESLMKKLLADGVIKPRPAAEAGATAPTP
jgi:hypothetical protein